MKRKKIISILSAFTVASTLLLGNIKFVNAESLNSRAEAEKIVSEMTLDEKIGQMLMPDFRQWKQAGESEVQDFTEMNEEVAEIIDEFDLGGVILFAQNVKTTEQTAKLTHDLQQVAINDEDGNLPLLTTIDQEGGIVTRLGTGTNFPGNMAIGATKNEQSSYDTGSVIGKELNSLGINVNFAPSVDVNNNPLNPVIGLRSFSSNPDLVAKLGVKMIEGIQSNGVAAAAKHFPGHGDTATDSHYGLPKVDKSLEELKKVELKPFQAAIDNGVDMIMTAHIQFPQIEKDTYTSIKDGQEIQIPATLSDDILTGLLREDMNFDGVIITDALNMAAIAENFGEVETVKMAFEAGVDIALMPTILRSKADVPKLRAIVDGVKEAVENGEISEEKINESATRVVKLKIDRGVMNVANDNKTVEEKIANAKSIVGSKENRDVERRVSAEAITVVKNEENILPLNPKEGEKVLLIAPYDNELPGMKFGLNRLMKEGKVNSVQVDTYCYKSEKTMTEELKNKINEANYVVVLSEMGNYTHLNSTHWITAIPNEVVNYANELNKDSVVVSVGKPYDVAAHKNAKAEVIAYGYKGMDPTEADGGLSPVQAFGPNIPAAIEVVFGAAEARGTLPVSIPTVDENGTANLEVNAFDYGFGITNLTSAGITSIDTVEEAKSGDNIEVKITLDEIKNLKSEGYIAKINYNNTDFEFISVKSATDNTEIKNVNTEGKEISVELSDKEISEKTDLIMTLKVLSEEEKEVEIINSLEVVDSKDRLFNTSLENETIKIKKVEESKPGEESKPDEENKPNKEEKPEDNNGKGNLPNTGAVVTPVATTALGMVMTALGFALSKKKNKN
ncbi:MAG: glycoside hydrolase family 3 C-terminal domain-containing protein [Clostridium sp.]|nr:glycoside hydrolase family 3 C-terminal domain-containing protein [Clostridium sp.]